MLDAYRKMYLHLFHAITTATEELERQNYGNAKELLLRAQQWAEAIYRESGEGGGRGEGAPEENG